MIDFGSFDFDVSKSTVLYGGAFDPLTKAHQQIISELAEHCGKLIVAVTNHSYKNSVLPIEKRIECVKDFVRNFSNVDVVEQPARTYVWLWSWCFEGRDKPEVIAVGEDEWEDLNHGLWQYYDKLLKEYKFIVVPRTDNICSTNVRMALYGKMPYEKMENCIDRNVYDAVKPYFDKKVSESKMHYRLDEINDKVEVNAVYQNVCVESMRVVVVGVGSSIDTVGKQVIYYMLGCNDEMFVSSLSQFKENYRRVIF